MSGHPAGSGRGSWVLQHRDKSLLEQPSWTFHKSRWVHTAQWCKCSLRDWGSRRGGCRSYTIVTLIHSSFLYQAKHEKKYFQYKSQLSRCWLNARERAVIQPHFIRKNFILHHLCCILNESLCHRDKRLSLERVTLVERAKHLRREIPNIYCPNVCSRGGCIQTRKWCRGCFCCFLHVLVFGTA